jgi:hypothetical protein
MWYRQLQFNEKHYFAAMSSTLSSNLDKGNISKVFFNFSLEVFRVQMDGCLTLTVHVLLTDERLALK